jgi:hypothetical protein
MRNFRRDALEWTSLAQEARSQAIAQDDEFTKPALEVAHLCDHIAAAMERINDIIESYGGCRCGKCPKPKASHLQ